MTAAQMVSQTVDTSSSHASNRLTDEGAQHSASVPTQSHLNELDVRRSNVGVIQWSWITWLHTQPCQLHCIHFHLDCDSEERQTDPHLRKDANQRPQVQPGLCVCYLCSLTAHERQDRPSAAADQRDQVVTSLGQALSSLALALPSRTTERLPSARQSVAISKC